MFSFPQQMEKASDRCQACNIAVSKDPVCSNNIGFSAGLAMISRKYPPQPKNRHSTLHVQLRGKIIDYM